MQVTETLSEGLKRAYTVVIPAAEIEKQVESKIKELNATIRLPGFRPGKAPMSLLRKRYGQSALGDVLQDTVNKSATQTLEERDLKPALQPNITLDENYAEGKDLSFDISLEILPDVSLMNFSDLALERPVIDISDEAVQEAIDRLAENQKTTEVIEGNPAAENGNVVTIDFKGTVDGEAHEGMDGEDFGLELGSGRFIPGFEEQLVGAKGGEDHTVTVTFPDDYPAEHLAGKEAVFEVAVKDVRRTIAPEINDEFASNFGFGSLDELKDMVRNDLAQTHQETTRSVVKRRVLDQLDANHSFELPEGMVNQEFDGIWRQIEEDRKNDRLDEDDAAKDEETLKTDYRKIAERRVKLGLVLSSVSAQNEIEIKEEDLSQAIIQEARRYPGQEHQVVEFFRENREARMNLQPQIMENKVIDYILEMAEVTDVSMTPEALNELIEQMEKEASES